MAWHYKHPSTFPAAYGAAITSAASNLEEPHMLGGFIRLSQAQALQNQIRYYKWCIRQNPATHPDLYSIIENFDIRTAIKDDPFGFILWLTVKPTKISDFVTLNPELSSEILATV